MKSWKVRTLAVAFTAAAMLFAVSGLTAMAQVVVNYDVHGYVCYDLDGDGLIDTCSTCFDTDGDGLADTCFENEGFADRIGQPIGSDDGLLGSNDPVSSDEGSIGSDAAKDDEDEPLAADAGKDDEDEPLAADAGKGED
jgi:hypothetical protein